MSYEEYKDIDSRDLIRMALEEEDDDKYWDYISALHFRPDRDVFDMAASLCKSDNPEERATGADIMAQLLKKVGERKLSEITLDEYEMPFREETLDIYYEMLKTEESPDVLRAILIGIHHVQENDDLNRIDTIIKYKDHESSDVRYGLAIALQGREDDMSVSTLIELMEDPDDEVRNWSTFGIGTQIEVDTPEIRQALWNRVNDEHDETRCEAINGLAERKDEGAYDLILKEIETGDPYSLIFEGVMKLEDSRLITPLKKLLSDVEAEEDVDDHWVRRLKDTIESLEEL